MLRERSAAPWLWFGLALVFVVALILSVTCSRVKGRIEVAEGAICEANLRLLEQACRTYAHMHDLAEGSPIDPQALVSARLIRELPVCPSGDFLRLCTTLPPEGVPYARCQKHGR